MIFDCPYCEKQLENLDSILEELGGYTICPYCYEMLRVDPLTKESEK